MGVYRPDPLLHDQRGDLWMPPFTYRGMGRTIGAFSLNTAWPNLPSMR